MSEQTRPCSSCGEMVAFDDNHACVATYLHASANPFSTDRDPKATARAVLAELATCPPFLGLTSRQLQTRLYGSQKVGAGNVHSAIGALRNDRLIERCSVQGKRGVRITALGREQNPGIQAFMGNAS